MNEHTHARKPSEKNCFYCAGHSMNNDIVWNMWIYINREKITISVWNVYEVSIFHIWFQSTSRWHHLILDVLSATGQTNRAQYWLSCSPRSRDLQAYTYTMCVCFVWHSCCPLTTDDRAKWCARFRAVICVVDCARKTQQFTQTIDGMHARAFGI